MKAIAVGPEGARLAEVAMPVPKANEVLVKVHAAALNRADIRVSEGHLHGSIGGSGAVVGLEWAGEVAGLGADVPAGFAVGDAVMCTGSGAYAEYAVTDWGRVFKLPAGMSDFVQAATLPIALITAHEAIAGSGAFQRGQTVIVQGASSGVGLMCLQVARHLGASRVFGSSTNAERRARLAEFGAHEAFDSSDTAWPRQILTATGGQGVDLLIDFISAGTANPNMQATKVRGHIVNVGRLGGFSAEFDFDLHALRRIQYIGATFRTRSLDEVREIGRNMQRDLWDAVAAGQLHLPVSATFPLARALDALAQMRSNTHFGKIVLTV